MLEGYDPLDAPDPEEWLECDESQRHCWIQDYHEAAGIEVPNKLMHAVVHDIVENQIAMGDETPARETLDRLMREGLDRHDAIHAVGSVMAEKIFQALSDEDDMEDFSEHYRRNLNALTAKKWRNQ